MIFKQSSQETIEDDVIFFVDIDSSNLYQFLFVSSKLQMRNPIWTLLKGHNSEILPWPTDKHPEINYPSYMLAKKYTNLPWEGGGRLQWAFQLSLRA